MCAVQSRRRKKVCCSWAMGKSDGSDKLTRIALVNPDRCVGVGACFCVFEMLVVFLFGDVVVGELFGRHSV